MMYCSDLKNVAPLTHSPKYYFSSIFQYAGLTPSICYPSNKCTAVVISDNELLFSSRGDLVSYGYTATG